MNPSIPMEEYFGGEKPRRPNYYWNKLLGKITRDFVFHWPTRNRLYRLMGVKLPKDSKSVIISREAFLDDNCPELITIEEGARISFRAIILTHNSSQYPHIVAGVTIKRKALIGTAAIIMPGVVVGEYAQVGSGAVVTKDVEPYTVVAGVPAKKIKDKVDLEPER